MPGRTLALFFFCLLLLCARTALGDALPRVLVLDTERPAPQGFVDALKIQAAGDAEIVAGGKVEGTLTEKVASVDAPLAKEHASVGVWVETADDVHLVYVVTRRRNRVLLEVVRLPTGDSAETDRALAIKVRDVLDTLLAGAGGEPDVTTTLRPEPAERPANTEPTPEATAWWLLQGGFAGVTKGNGSTSDELGAALATGARFGARDLFFEGLAGVWLLNGTDRTSGAASVRTRELELSLSFRALVASRLFAGGLHLDGVMRVVAAHGAGANGDTGDATSLVPLVRIGPELRWRVSRNVDLRGAGGFDLALRRQRYSVVGEEITDLGTTRASYELGVVVALP
jgi:hypothetical protein